MIPIHYLKMKRLLALICCFVASWTAVCAQNVNPKPAIVPELTTWQGAVGRFNLTDGTCIVAADTRCKEVAETFSDDFNHLFGRRFSTAVGRAGQGDILLSLKKQPSLGKEGYQIRIGRRVELTAATVVGLYWGTRSLLQMALTSRGRMLPCGSATDKPRYAVRGMLFDVGRKYIPMDYLHKLVKVMAFYKMNTLQVHLNDDGAISYDNSNEQLRYTAFRLECSTYPELTARDGSYTKDEFRAFQKEAAKMGVNIVPEIDSPAHSAAFTHYNPRLGSKKYGWWFLDLLNPETYSFMDALWKEYLEGDDPVFSGPIVSIGTDEYAKTDTVVVEAFRRYTDHYIHLVESYGKTADLWGALTHFKGHTPVKSEGVIMNLWFNGYADPKEMLSQGFRGISIPDGLVYIVPRAGYYNDYLDCEKIYREWTPNVVGNVTFPADNDRILGGMFAVWNDKNGNGITVKDIHYRIMPALKTMAAKCWTAQAVTMPWEAFRDLCDTLPEAAGVNELARYGKPHSLVLQKKELTCGATLTLPEIGYDYTVEFTVNGAAEKPGTELFGSPSAVVYLADPVGGMMAFARDGYLTKFNYRPIVGRTDRLRITGNRDGVKLYVNGRLENDLAPIDVTLHGNEKLSYVRTLVFPLGKVGHFESRISDLKVYNDIRSQND